MLTDYMKKHDSLDVMNTSTVVFLIILLSCNKLNEPHTNEYN